jgi:hypothetical protein
VKLVKDPPKDQDPAKVKSAKEVEELGVVKVKPGPDRSVKVVLEVEVAHGRKIADTLVLVGLQLALVWNARICPAQALLLLLKSKSKTHLILYFLI